MLPAAEHPGCVYAGTWVAYPQPDAMAEPVGRDSKQTAGPPACPICADLLFEAFVAPCGHSVCVDCKNSLCKEKREPRCPQCRERVKSYVPNFTARSIVEELFAAEYKERKGRTVAGQIAKLLAEHPDVSIVDASDRHSDEFVLFVLTVMLSAKTTREACNIITEATADSRVTVIASPSSSEASITTWCRYATYVRSERMDIRVFSDGNPNPLEKQKQKRAREDYY